MGHWWVIGHSENPLAAAAKKRKTGDSGCPFMHPLRRPAMADWKKLAKALALADGRIDTKETDIIRRELYADGKLDRSELEFLLDLRKTAGSCVNAFSELCFNALKPVILADGKIDAKEAAWLRKFIFADN